MIRIVADADIPNLPTLLGDAGHVTSVPGRDIDAVTVKNADVLLVRSVTKVNSGLLGDSRVRFVGSATAGVDHVDSEFLRSRGIVFQHAPGSNAESVVEYVLAAMYSLAVQSGVRLHERVVGIVGCGNVGGRLARRLVAAGLRVIVNDPPLEARGEAFAPGLEISDLVGTVRKADILTLHVPLEREGAYPTYRLMTNELFGMMRPNAWLINTSRGLVMDESSLMAHLKKSDAGPAVLDVWESEPEPNPLLVRMSRICTPHIAGYSADARLTGARMIAGSVRRFLGKPVEDARTDAVSKELRVPDRSLTREEWLHDVIRQMYDIEGESEDFRRRILDSRRPAETFTQYRRDYPRRYSFGRYFLDERRVPAEFLDVTRSLGVNVQARDTQS